MRVEECNSYLLRLLFFSRCYWNKGSISLSKPVVSKNSPDYDPWVKDILKMNWDQQYSERPSTLQKSKDLIEKIRTRSIFWWISRPNFKLAKVLVMSAGRRCSIWNRWLRPSIFWRRITSRTMKPWLKKQKLRRIDITSCHSRSRILKNEWRRLLSWRSISSTIRKPRKSIALIANPDIRPNLILIILMT